MRARKRILDVLIALGLLVAAHSANAGLLTVNVSTVAFGGSSGEWSLTGPDPASESWFHAFVDSDSWDVGVSPGVYDFNIKGVGVGFGKVSWSLAYNGHVFYEDKQGIFLKVKFKDETAFVVPVPEPAPIGLLGAGLLGLVAFRRLRAAAT